MRSENTSGDVGPRNPITGIVGCCARAASGHVAAVPPSSVMNSRRLIWSNDRIAFGSPASQAALQDIELAMVSQEVSERICNQISNDLLSGPRRFDWEPSCVACRFAEYERIQIRSAAGAERQGRRANARRRGRLRA